MSRLVSDSESQAQPCVLVDGAAPVLTAHAADRGETFQDEEGKKMIKGQLLVSSGD